MTLICCWMHWFWITISIILYTGGNCSPLISAPINATQPALPISEEYSSSASPVFTAPSSPVTRVIYVTVPPTETSPSTLSPSTSTTVSPDTTPGFVNVTEEVVVSTVTPPDDNGTSEITTTESVQVHEARQAPTGNRTGEVSAGGGGGLDSAGIAGICFGTLVVLALGGAVSFVLYRRRYLNKPQTLNDKCSNPDSSGYIDDSTIRENSEEMYSLDNDSFLNSLEAMTIQNYWTDTVKHTKL